MKFSVLMSVYYKEKPEYLKECLDSIITQTLAPDEVLLIKDGPLTRELDCIIDGYKNKYSSLLKILELKENVGLGRALALGVENASNELIARMDTDDICRSDRFEIQMKAFEKNSELDICGSHIIEFDGDINNILSKRNVPIENEEIFKFAKKRNPLNHMTVMYKKESVLKAGNYQDANGFEDYFLWSRMLVRGCKFKNIDDYLVYARTGSDMFKRRGGTKYLKDAINAKKKLREIGLYSYKDYIISCGSHVAVSLMPNSLRQFIYTKLLRK